MLKDLVGKFSLKNNEFNENKIDNAYFESEIGTKMILSGKSEGRKMATNYRT